DGILVDSLEPFPPRLAGVLDVLAPEVIEDRRDRLVRDGDAVDVPVVLDLDSWKEWGDCRCRLHRLDRRDVSVEHFEIAGRDICRDRTDVDAGRLLIVRHQLPVLIVAVVTARVVLEGPGNSVSDRRDAVIV